VTLVWQSGALFEGALCYRNQQFWLAHEHWESVWLRLEEPEKTFLQSLIQITAAFHHLQTENTRGAISLLRRALRQLEPYPALFGGIDLARLRNQTSEWLQALESASPRPANFPQICLA
jgi:uncharacterized protein